MTICQNGKARFSIRTRAGYETLVTMRPINFSLVNTKYQEKFKEFIRKTFDEREEQIIKK